ncbi:MAG: peptide-methionine (R)-S-oxide reductase MsrB [Balneolaceae bacterium]
MPTKFYITLFYLIAAMAAISLSNCKKSDVQADHHSHDHFQSLTYQISMSDTSNSEKIVKSEEEWKEQLSREEYRILRRGGTELPYVNKYNSVYEEGIYVCKACGNPLFDSETKYKSGTGWPSFWKPIREGAVGEREDNSLFMTRTEVICNRCESHLGHVFEDGPEPTGLRYCLNSAALKLVKKND